MNAISQHGAGASKVDIKTRLNTTHNPLFPFSSPNLDDASLKSGQSGHTCQSQNPFESDLSTPPLDNGRGSMSDNDEFHLERYSQHIKQKQLAREKAAAKKDNIRKKPRPSLRIVTSSSGGQHRNGNLVINQVAAKQPKQGKSRAISVVSQKGIKGLPSPYYQQKSVQEFSNVRKLVGSKVSKDHGSRSVARRTKTTNSTTKTYSPARSSVIFGLSIPSHQVPAHHQSNELQSAVTLITPVTPKIVVTPAGNDDAPKYFDNVEGRRYVARKTPSISVYTDESPGTDGSAPTQATALPLRGLYEERSTDLNENRRHSSDSQQEIIADSSDTARPKSQGWWNLMLSPMLSRAGTLKKLLRDEVIPPVPPVPVDLEKDVLVQTPITYMSPVTPRRLGLAGIRRSASSSWTQWEDEQASGEVHDRNLEEVHATLPKDHLAHAVNSEFSVATDNSKREGLAAEYYHACAIEQLSNATYFECVNHSCSEHLPKLCSVYDTADNKPKFVPFILNERGLEVADVAKSSSVVSKRMQFNDVNPTGHRQHTESTSKTSVLPKSDEISPLTPIDSEVDIEEFVSPNVRHAKAAAFSKPKKIQPTESNTVAPSATTASSAKKLSIEPSPFTRQEAVHSPGPVSPEATRTIAPSGGVQMAPVQSLHADRASPLIAPVPQAKHALVNQYQPSQTIVYYPYTQPTQYPFYPQTLPAHPAIHHYVPNTGTQGEQDGRYIVPVIYSEPGKPNESNTMDSKVMKKETTKDVEGQKKKKKAGVFGLLCCFNRTKSKESKKKHQYTSLGVFLVIVVIACILFAIFFSRGHGNANPVVSQWLNLTGYPPVPTGVSTIISPNLATSQNQCVQPTTLWSCALSKEEQAAYTPTAPDQPNFRFQIRFQNGTVPSNMTIPLDGKRVSDQGTDDSVVSSPTPPGQLDQIFMGNTTDNVTLPFDGEVTPFFITFMTPLPGQSTQSNQTKKLATRQSNNGDFSDLIPAPSIGSDGTAAPVSLIPENPLPISQPLKLYNRGLRDEHYGFYIYYDKSIFLSGISIRSNSTTVTSPDTDQNGGSVKTNANVRCTWSQTRFLVRIYTNPIFNAHLLPAASTTTNTTSTNQLQQSPNARPGSFPYPTTITLDRHGGDSNRKFIYCYGMNTSTTKINPTDKKLVFEMRSFGGVPINASPGPLILNSTSPSFDSNAGGIDGGTGGCGCEWRNWN